jgi:hypothetical protein
MRHPLSSRLCGVVGVIFRCRSAQRVTGRDNPAKLEHSHAYTQVLFEPFTGCSGTEGSWLFPSVSSVLSPRLRLRDESGFTSSRAVSSRVESRDPSRTLNAWRDPEKRVGEMHCRVPDPLHAPLPLSLPETATAAEPLGHILSRKPQ